MTIKFKRDDTYMEMNVGIVLMIASGYGNASNSLEVMTLRRLTLIVQPLKISYSVVGHVMLFVATNLYANHLILYSSSGYNDMVAHIGRGRLNVWSVCQL